LAAGDAVGYGSTWRAPRATRIATVGFGYVDGVPWALANRGEMTLRGRRGPIRGRGSRDLTTLDWGGGPGGIRGEGTPSGAGGPGVGGVGAGAGTMRGETLVGVGGGVPRVPVGSAA